MLSTIGATSQPNEQLLSGVIGAGDSSIMIQANNNTEGEREMSLSEKVEKTIQIKRQQQ